MKIAIVGAGGIGSTFAVQLARSRHDVTLVARGKRLAQLESAGGVTTSAGLVRVLTAAKLDETVPWDLVLVTVLAFQVDALLPALGASAAKQVMFMFNTLDPLDRLREAVGPERFAFGFPSILAHVDERARLARALSTRADTRQRRDRREVARATSDGAPRPPRWQPSILGSRARAAR